VNYYRGDDIKEHEVGKTRGTHERYEEFTQNYSRET